MKIANIIRGVLEDVVQVTERPEGGSGEDWWVGLYIGGDGLWDSSCQNKNNAEAARQRVVDALHKALTDAIGL